MSEETILKAEESAKLKVKTSWPALLLIAAGALMLGATLFDLDLIDILWPGFIIGPGLLLLWPAHNVTADRSSRLATLLAVPGAMMLTTGGLLFVMNISGYFDAWAYSWTLVLASAAAGLMYAKRFDENSRVHERGHKFIRLMGLLFIGMAVFFEIVIFEHFNPLLSLTIIGLGFYILLRDRKQLA